MLYRRLSALLLGAGMVAGLGAAEPGPDPIRVRFWADEIEVTGAMPDKRTAHRWLMAIFAAQGRRGVCDRLTIDPGRAMIELPSIDEMAGLILELSLSTTDGCLTITPGSIAVSGLTDSQVTHAAFAARLQLIDGRHAGRLAVNRICIVTEDELKLAYPNRPRPVLNPEPLPIAPVLLADAELGPPPAPLIAAPIAQALVAQPLAAGAMTATAAASVLPPALTPSPTVVEPAAAPDKAGAFEALAPVGFEQNTYLVRSDQFRPIDAAIDRIRALPADAGPVVVRGYPDEPGRYEFGTWLGQSRAASVSKLIEEAGIPVERLRIEAAQTRRRDPHLGKVVILIPKPPTMTAVEASPPPVPAPGDPM